MPVRRFLFPGVIAASAALLAASGCTPRSEQKARAEYLVLHPNMPRHIREAIRNKSIVRGMTKADVRISWGRPCRIEKVGDKTEAWIYKRRVLGAGNIAHVRTYRILFIDERVATFVEIARR